MEENKPGIIYETDDYSKFKYIQSNRVVNRHHVQALIRSMEDFPDLIQTRPILVNDKMEVIDGQHRLQALLTLGRKVYYQIAPDTAIEDAQVMNALQRGWSILDYARSFALNDNRDYQTFMEIYEEYGLPPSVLMQYLAENSADRHNSRRFKRGQFKVRPREEYKKLLDQLEDMSEFVPFWKEYKFSMAMLKIFKTVGYDHKRMLQKLAYQKPQRQGSAKEFIREMEDIYNWKTQEENRLRFWA